MATHSTEDVLFQYMCNKVAASEGAQRAAAIAMAEAAAAVGKVVASSSRLRGGCSGVSPADDDCGGVVTSSRMFRQ